MSDASAGSKFYQKTISKENQGIPRNIKSEEPSSADTTGENKIDI